MYCAQCGQLNADYNLVCVRCRQQLSNPRQDQLKQMEYNTNSLGGLIPYKNAPALASYYTGLFSILPIPVVGLGLSVAALVCGVMGLKKSRNMPESKGKVHCYVGLTLGTIGLLMHLAIVLAIVMSIMSKR